MEQDIINFTFRTRTHHDHFADVSKMVGNM